MIRQGSPTNARETAGADERPYDAVIFDLLSALIDSWTLWNDVAGSAETGMRWRMAYLRHTYGARDYRPYETLVAEAAAQADIPAARATALLARWDELASWPEASATLGALAARLPLAAVTNCSEALGRRAVARMGIQFAVVVTAERAGAYKPDPRPYRRALAELAVAPERALFVAGSPFDVPGASAVGMPVVWHNRLGQSLPPGNPRPLTIIDNLTPLVELLSGDGR